MMEEWNREAMLPLLATVIRIDNMVVILYNSSYDISSFLGLLIPQTNSFLVDLFAAYHVCWVDLD